MYSIRENYTSSPSSGSDGGDGDDGDGRQRAAASASDTPRATPLRYAAARALPRAPARLWEVSQSFATCARRPRPPTADGDERTFRFRGYEPKRRRRTSVVSTPPTPLPPPPPAPETAGVFAGLAETVNAPGRARIGPDGRLEPSFRLRGHSKPVTALRWNERFPSLALSASLDTTLRVWTVADRRSRQVLRVHGATGGVKSAAWTLDGRRALSGGLDGRAALTDVETGRLLHELALPFDGSSAFEAVTSVATDPSAADVVAIGTSRGGIHALDLRAPSWDRPALSFTRVSTHVLDLLFLPPGGGGGDGSGAQLVSSAEVARRDGGSRTLLVWDARSSALLFDRLDDSLEAFHCLRRHPARAQFAAQSAGAAGVLLFSARPPYKRVRRAGGRLAGFAGAHEAAGYAVQCSFSPDGALLASGDAGGRLVLYRDADGGVAQTLRLADGPGEPSPVIAAEFSPAGQRDAALVAGDWRGCIHVLRLREKE